MSRSKPWGPFHLRAQYLGLPVRMVQRRRYERDRGRMHVVEEVAAPRWAHFLLASLRPVLFIDKYEPAIRSLVSDHEAVQALLASFRIGGTKAADEFLRAYIHALDDDYINTSVPYDG